MNDEVIADLKQFIATTVSQAVAPLAADMGTLKSDVAGLKNDVAELKADVAVLKTDVAEIKQGLEDVNLRLDTIADALTETQNDHERRIVRLEHKLA